MNINFANVPGIIQYENGNFQYSLMTINELATDNYSLWKGQRFINRQHIKEIKEEMINSINTTKNIKYSSSLPHIALTADKKKYIIDGQHRIEVYKEICKKHNNAIKVLVLYEYCNNEEQVMEAFKRSNTQWEQNDEVKKWIHGEENEHPNNNKPQNNIEVIQKLWNEKLEEYGGLKGMFSRSSKPQKPHLNENNFLNSLTSSNDPNKNITYEQLKSQLNNANEKIKNLKSTNEYKEKNPERWKKCEKFNCYIGLVEDFTIYMNNEIPKRKKLPDGIRKKLWKNHFGDYAAVGNCKVCTDQIHINRFEAGHIVSVAKGGSDHIENLLPICQNCNRSMGTTNLYEYKNTYFK